uniref:Methyltransferase n=1 Tax=Ochrobactrum sp. LM19 TaxID=1449781 RepID=A0A0D5A0K7_9HYPH|nr:N-6 DNA methylase [Ochrobactrum sp. LM19]AJW29949.1 methyltransferase [Ochrobactrum sp. LM19]
MQSPHIKAIVKLFETFRYKHDLYGVFSDWNQCAAIALSNAADLTRYEKREARYLEIVRKYEKVELETFSTVLGEVTLALEERPQDVLGTIFHALELHNSTRGQFFTPYSICSMMARLVMGTREELQQKIEERGFICAEEPAVGAGAMVIALAEAIKEMGINYQQCLHVTAVDIDPRAVHMSYIQFTLMHIPAVVLQGNSLAMTVQDEWHTLAHVMGNWRSRLAKAGNEGERSVRPSIEMPEPDNVSATVARISKKPVTHYEAGKGGQMQLF